MMTLKQFRAGFAVGVDEAMRDMVLGQKIMQMPTGAIVARTDHAQAGKLVIAEQALPAHDESVYDRLADAGELRECAA